MPSLIAVTAAAHRAAGTHGAWIVGALVAVLVVGIAWNRIKRRRAWYAMMEATYDGETWRNEVYAHDE